MSKNFEMVDTPTTESLFQLGGKKKRKPKQKEDDDSSSSTIDDSILNVAAMHELQEQGLINPDQKLPGIENMPAVFPLTGGANYKKKYLKYKKKYLNLRRKLKNS